MADTAPLAGELDTATPAKSLLEKVLGRRETHPKYSPSDLKKIAQKYVSNIGLGEDVTFGAQSFDKHMTGRIKTFNELQQAKTPQGEVISKKLSDASPSEEEENAKKFVKEAINQLLKPSAELTEAQAKYTESVKLFKDLVQKTSQSRNVQNIIGVMEDLVEEGKKAIQKQQAAEIDALKANFDKADFKANVAKALNLNENQIEETKKNLLDDLAQSHKKQIEEFNKSTQESVRALHTAAANQRRAFYFIASLHNNDLLMNREIEKLADEAREAHGDNDLEILMSEDKTDISCVSIDQLKFIQLLGGGKINREIDEATGKNKVPASFKLEIGSQLFNPRYFGNDRHKRDMLVMAQGIRASGSTGITMTLNFSDPKIANKRAREAFEACLKAGFPRDKIKLNVNGKLMAYMATDKHPKDGQKYASIAEELFADKQNKYHHLISQSDKIRKELDEFYATPKNTSKSQMAEIKADLEQSRKNAKNKPPAADEKAEPEGPSTINLGA